MYGIKSPQILDRVDVDPISISTTRNCRYIINAEKIIKKLDPGFLDKTALYSVKLKDQGGQ
jgi:hypothetical protein